jgi:micrococcal nuclease
MGDSPDKPRSVAYGERVTGGSRELMRSRRTNGLITIGSLVVLAALAGNASRGPDEIALAGAGQAPAVTVTRTPLATVAPTGDDASKAVAKKASDARAAAKKASDAKAAAAKAAASKVAADKTAKAKAKAAAGAKAKAAAATWAVTKVVDGDTIWVSRAGVSSKVRFIGIDTPESGQCGFTEARNALRGIIGGQRVTLTAGAQDGVDRYGRLLRYVDVSGVDAGLRLIKKGYAVARYDSRDGYGRHTRETAYVRADIASPKAACAEPDSGGSSGATSGGAWPLSGDRYPCPQTRPVKGNEDSWIAHEPGDRYYNVTKPEQCFATMSDAESAGFRPAKV